MTTIQATDIGLRLKEGVPDRVEHHGRVWRVIDNPTPLGNESAAYSGLITHPPAAWTGWRFTARADDDEVLTFDVRQRGDSWDLITTYR